MDEEQLVRPSHWDVRSIRRFMFRFGPISSMFDIATFLLIHVLHASAPEFRTGWFIESLAQTFAVFAIRTLRVPFFRSRPSLPLALLAAGVLVVGIYLTCRRSRRRSSSLRCRPASTWWSPPSSSRTWSRRTSRDSRSSGRPRRGRRRFGVQCNTGSHASPPWRHAVVAEPAA